MLPVIRFFCFFFTAAQFSKVVSQSITSATKMVARETTSIAVNPSSTNGNVAGKTTSTAVNPSSTNGNVAGKTTSIAVNPSSTNRNVAGKTTSIAVNAATTTQNAPAAVKTASLTSLLENTATPNVQQSGAWSRATQSKYAQTSEPQPKLSSKAAAMSTEIMPSKSGTYPS